MAANEGGAPEGETKGEPLTSEFDLTKTISPYMDLHMMFPLIDFLEQGGVYDVKDMLQVKLDLLEPTNMVDFAMDIYKTLHEGEEAPANMIEHRDEVVNTLYGLKAECDPLLELLEDEEKSQAALEASSPWEYCELQYEWSSEMLETYYQYSKFQFECGCYMDAAYYLSMYRKFDPESDKSFSALWGKLAAEILVGNWDNAYTDLLEIQSIIDNREDTAVRMPNHLEQLQLRSWLLHWSLFVFFNHPEGRPNLVDFFLQEKYINAVQTNCPWLLRYLTVAVVTTKSRRNEMKALIKVIQQEQYTYRDPVTEFIECLYVNFDFEAAQEKLTKCDQLLKSDFFLCYSVKDFMENARLFIFETYCRIHTKIDMAMLASKLNMQAEEAERWIVDLIRNAKFDAKIDSEQNHVIMGQQHPEIYQQIIDKTKDLSFRTYQLAGTVLSFDNRTMSHN